MLRVCAECAAGRWVSLGAVRLPRSSQAERNGVPARAQEAQGISGTVRGGDGGRRAGWQHQDEAGGRRGGLRAHRNQTRREQAEPEASEPGLTWGR